MNDLELWYAVKPLGFNQKFGENPNYYAKFGWKGHDGIDFLAPHATPLYAPVAGSAFYVQDAHGGDGIYIRTPDTTNPKYAIILWHLCSKDDPKYKPLIPTNGSVVDIKLGQLIGYTDNSGAPYESSGDHLHFGLMPLNDKMTALNPNNGYGGCINPMPFFNGKFAQDYIVAEQAIETASAVIAEPTIPVAEKIQDVNTIVKFIKWLLNL